MRGSKYTFIPVMLIIGLFYSTLLSQQVPGWVEESNKHTKLLLDILTEFNPETAAYYGVMGVDGETIDLTAGFVEREDEAYTNAGKELEQRLQSATISEVKQDIHILLNAVDEQQEGSRLNQKYFLPYYNISQTIFYSLQALLGDQIAEERYPAALVRLKKYTGTTEGYESLVNLASEHTRSKLGEVQLLGPVKKQVERDLENVERFKEGIKNLFEKYKVEGYQSAYQKLAVQLDEYSDFIKKEVLPRSREDFRLPEEYYRFSLKGYGVDMPIEEMMQRAKVTFKSFQNELNSLSRMLAKEKGWDIEDYRDIIKKLKKEQIVGDKILPLYRERIKQLEEIARKNKIVSLPEREMTIRLASEAESASLPAPHMRPPRLIGNNGEQGEFILPLKFPGKDLTIDDFTHEATTWTLAVHEGRPGHEIQFTALVEKGVSLARAMYAFNSVNVEGWALYMEAEMKPYLPLKAQIGAAQSLLIRSARAFLDPGLQLGQITVDDVKRVLGQEAVLSEALVLQEVQRYTFRAPGQATSYFCGYQRMMELRTDVELKLGDRFDKQAFHDFILGQGLLPPFLIRQIVLEKFIPQYIATN